MTEEKILKLELNENEANAVLTALDQMPHGQVRGLIDKIVTTAREQFSEATPSEE
jgi:hypothetical protein